MGPKQFTERILIITSQFIRTDLTRNLFSSLKEDGVPFTSLVAFDGSPEKEMKDLLKEIDIALFFKKPIHSGPEIANSLFNFAKSTDAEFVMFCDNDVEFKKGSFRRLATLMDQYDAISPVKIDKDYERFKNYSSDEEPIEVIGSNDSVWFFRVEKIPLNPIDREGRFGFEDVPFNYKLWKNGVKFVVDPKAVIFHRGSQEVSQIFSPEDRKKYSDEWDLKRDLFLRTHGPDAEWFFNNVIMNAEGIKRFGYPVFVFGKKKTENDTLNYG